MHSLVGMQGLSSISSVLQGDPPNWFGLWTPLVRYYSNSMTGRQCYQPVKLMSTLHCWQTIDNMRTMICIWSKATKRRMWTLMLRLFHHKETHFLCRFNTVYICKDFPSALVSSSVRLTVPTEKESVARTWDSDRKTERRSLSVFFTVWHVDFLPVYWHRVSSQTTAQTLSASSWLDRLADYRLCFRLCCRSRCSCFSRNIHPV